MKLSTLLTPVILLASEAFAKDEFWINCKQVSRRCRYDNIGPAKDRDSIESTNPTLTDLIEAASWQLNDTRIYDNEHYAVCVSSSGFANWGLCAYPMNTENGINGSTIKELLVKLDEHHCKRCGRVSMFDPPMDMSLGYLQVNNADNVKWEKPVCKPVLADATVDVDQDVFEHKPPH
ncbi:hypothetical protein MBLNU457_g2582t1 [Dothideomycetes sp. NU457]